MQDLRQGVQSILGHFGYRLSRIEHSAVAETLRTSRAKIAPPAAPIWPLPRRAGITDLEIRHRFEKYDAWHYAYAFDGGLSFPARTPHAGPLTLDSDRPLKRYRHFMPYLLQRYRGSLRGKRVLDIACNSGFWSVQCALLGAEVVGFDARPELIEQANLIKDIVGVPNVEFRLLDFWDMAPAALGGKFDIVLNLGILYHLPAPLEALRITAAMSDDSILLDTEVYPSSEAAIQLRWEEPLSIRSANRSGIVALPSKQGLELMLKDVGAREWFEIPLGDPGMPADYREQRRTSWLITL